MYNAFIYLLIGILVIASLLLVLIVLMQRPKNEGLGASFGGGMTQDLFGAQTTSVLQKFTVYLGGAFFAISLLLTVLYSKSSSNESRVLKSLETSSAGQTTVPSVTPAPAATPASEAVPATSPALEESADPAAPVESASPTDAPAAAVPETSPVVEPASTPQ